MALPRAASWPDSAASKAVGKHRSSPAPRPRPRKVKRADMCPGLLKGSRVVLNDPRRERELMSIRPGELMKIKMLIVIGCRCRLTEFWLQETFKWVCYAGGSARLARGDGEGQSGGGCGTA